MICGLLSSEIRAVQTAELGMHNLLILCPNLRQFLAFSDVYCRPLSPKWKRAEKKGFNIKRNAPRSVSSKPPPACPLNPAEALQVCSGRAFLA